MGLTELKSGLNLWQARITFQICYSLLNITINNHFRNFEDKGKISEVWENVEVTCNLNFEKNSNKVTYRLILTSS